MADISKCTGYDCPLKDECYRFLVTPSMHQSWAPFHKELKPDGTCEYFMREKTK